MKVRRLLGLLVLAVAPLGCNYWIYATHNLVHQPIQSCDDHIECLFIACEAKKAWEQVGPTSAMPQSKAFACGFKEGFVDYVRHGGNGEPPVLPPWCLWLSCSQSEEGQQAQDNYFAGFRQGAFVARRSGLRDLVVIQTGRPPHPGPTRTAEGGTIQQSRTPDPEPILMLPTPEEKLPSPRKTPDESKESSNSRQILPRAVILIKNTSR
jgi:hypothetical protein